MKLYYDEQIAENITRAINGTPEQRELINSAIDKIYSYACYNEDFEALFSALNEIYGE